MVLPSAFENALKYILSHYMESISTDDLERAAGISKFAVSRMFHKKFNMSPVRWVWEFRVMIATQLIKHHPEMTTREISLLCGFETPSHFCRLFREVIGTSPGSYKMSSELTNVCSHTLGMARQVTIKLCV